MEPSKECVRCGCEMRPGRNKQRPHLRIHSGRGLCSVCYWIVDSSGQLSRYERNYRSRDDLMDDWVALCHEGYTRRQAAERLGMDPEAFIRAHQRAEAAGDPRAIPDRVQRDYRKINR